MFDEVERKYVRGNEKGLKVEYEILSKIKKVKHNKKTNFTTQFLYLLHYFFPIFLH